MREKKKMRSIFGIAGILLILLVLGSCGFLYSKGWLHRTFKAGDEAKVVMSGEAEAYNLEILPDGSAAFLPQDPKVGLIFYPGGLVEYTAYAPLMDRLARQHAACILLKTKSGLPMFEKNIADGKMELFPDLKKWYIGGHSMGGLAAAAYVSDHTEMYEGLILLASYSGKDLSKEDLKVLCVYGTEDGVMNREMYEDSKKLLPADFEERVIEGGCHSYFADYGVKGGDGTPTISMQEQMNLTAEAMLHLLLD